MEVVKVADAKEAFAFFESCNRWTRFRGQKDASWRLGTTLARHRPTALCLESGSDEIDRMVDEFLAGVLMTGASLPFHLKNRRGQLEYARHFGLPSPLVDLTMSPYVAAFFAFNGVRPADAKPYDEAAVYCLDMFALALMWSDHLFLGRDDEEIGLEYAQATNGFLYSETELFTSSYDIGVLNYVEIPASWNRRMQRQHGVFLYDTLNYPAIGLRDLEDFLSKKSESPGQHGDRTVLRKLIIPHRAGREVFERLDLVGATGTHLYDNPEGAVMDVVNGYNYARRGGRAWDVEIRSGSIFD